MSLAGFNVASAVEIDRYACESYRWNFPRTNLYEGDVSEFNELPRKVLRSQFNLGEADVVFGGPPCQGYSQIGTRDIDDPRNKLYLEFVNTLKLYRPRVFIMENVVNMLRIGSGVFRDAVLAAFRKNGYKNCAYVTAKATEFGVPQQRVRVFYFGIRNGEKLPYDLLEFVRAALEVQQVCRPVTVWEAIGDLPKSVVPSGGTLPYRERKRVSQYMREMRLDHDGDIYPSAQKLGSGIRRFGESTLRLHNHHTKEVQERRMQLIRKLEPGGRGDSIPANMWKGVRPQKWRRLSPEKPAHTLLAQMHRDLSEWVHPKHDRWISVREACRLQSFHDGYIMRSSEWQMLKQIGNAVPPLLALAVGNAAQSILSALDGTPIQDPRDDAIRRRIEASLLTS